MHRFPDFNDSTFMSFFSAEGRNALMEILANPEMIKPNYMGWAQDFSIDPITTVHDNKGEATVRAYMRQIENGVMSDMRAPLGDSLPMEQGNAEFYTAPIAHFTTKHFHDTTPTLYDKRKRWEELRDAYGRADAEFIQAYAENLQILINGVNMSLTNMGEQLQTNGYLYYDKGAGIKAGIYKANIPEKNFRNAGTVAWSDTVNCKLVDQLRKLVDDVNTENGFGEEFKWQLDIPKAVWDNYFMKNAQVLELIRWRQNINGVSLPSVVYVTNEMAEAMFAEQAGLPKIVVHDTKQKDEFKGIVRGWKTGIATLRPLGKAGLIRHTNPLDAEYFGDDMTNPAITDIYTPALYGLGYLENSVWPNGRMKEYRTRFTYSATPTLDEFLYHYIIKTTVAD